MSLKVKLKEQKTFTPGEKKDKKERKETAGNGKGIKLEKCLFSLICLTYCQKVNYDNA